MTRTCGSCTACCTVMGVPSIEKEADMSCEKLCAGAAGASGCSVYAERPQECSDFSCVWLQDDGRVFRNMERPDQVGVLFDVGREGAVVRALIARPTRAGAFKEQQAIKLLERLTKKVLVIVVDGDKRYLKGPDHLVNEAKKKIKFLEVVS